MKNVYRYYALLFFCACVFVFPLVNDVDLSCFVRNQISVQVKGEVVEEKIYTCDLYTTIGQLLEKVELTEQADTTNINLDTVLKNHDVVVIPKVSVKELVSINYSSVEELMTLPSIGEVTAKRIIEYRTINGLFQNLEDLKKVKGIGDKTFEKLKDLIQL